MFCLPNRLVALTLAFMLYACGVSDGSGTGTPTHPESAGLPSFATDDVAYLTRLGLIRGHLAVGMELYENGAHEHAKSHMKHPADELYSTLAPAFERRDSSGFAAELETLADLVQQDGEDADIEDAYAALLDAISAAESRVDARASGVGVQGAVAVNLLDEAAREYGIGVADGHIEEVHEYQDAYGFTRVAIDYARRAEAAHEPGHAVGAAVNDLEGLDELWPSLVPDTGVEGGARRIESVAEKLAAKLTESVHSARQ